MCTSLWDIRKAGNEFENMHITTQVGANDGIYRLRALERCIFLGTPHRCGHQFVKLWFRFVIGEVRRWKAICQNRQSALRLLCSNGRDRENNEHPIVSTTLQYQYQPFHTRTQNPIQPFSTLRFNIFDTSFQSEESRL
jgi:hypothetical protein